MDREPYVWTQMYQKVDPQLMAVMDIHGVKVMDSVFLTPWCSVKINSFCELFTWIARVYYPLSKHLWVCMHHSSTCGCRYIWSSSLSPYGRGSRVRTTLVLSSIKNMIIPSICAMDSLTSQYLRRIAVMEMLTIPMQLNQLKRQKMQSLIKCHLSRICYFFKLITEFERSLHGCKCIRSSSHNSF